jgi:hypothetical protein
MVSANEALGFMLFSVNLSGVDADTDQVFELIQKKCAAHSNGAEIE